MNKEYLPYVFILLTILTWGAYVPTIHEGQGAFIPRGPFRAFLFVGVAYCVMGLLIPGIILFVTKSEPAVFSTRGVVISTWAGVLGACGALGVIFALWFGGKPIYVAPLVFAGAPIMSVVVSMILHKPVNPPEPRFYLGLALAAVGAALVLRYKPV